MVSIQTFLIGLFQSTIAINISLIAFSHLELTGSQYSIFMGLFFSLSFVFNIFVGWISDKSKYPLLLFRIVTTTSVLAVFIFRFMGFITGSQLTIVFALAMGVTLVAIWFGLLVIFNIPEEKIILQRGIFSISWVIGPLVSAYALEIGSFNSLFDLITGLGICIIVASLFTNFDTKISNVVIKHDQNFRLWEILFHKKILVAIIAVILLQSSMALSTVLLPLLITSDFSANQSYVGLAFSACALFEIGFLYFGSRLLKNRAGIDLLLFSTLAGVIYFSALVTVKAEIYVVIIQFFNAIYIAGVIGFGMTWFQSVLHHSPTLATGIFVNCYNIGAMAVVAIIGTVEANFGTFQPAAMSALISVVFGGLLIWFYKSRYS